RTADKLVNDFFRDSRQRRCRFLLARLAWHTCSFCNMLCLTHKISDRLAADRIMASAASPGPTRSPVAVVSKEIPPTGSPDGTVPRKQMAGWVYLGHFVASEKKWKTRYFDFPASAEPTSLATKALKVRLETGSINVRVGMPTESGEFLSVKEVLKPESQIKVKSIREWSSTGYMWAEVDYET
ncbi:MAG: hypothetical protein Q7J42_09115, partial [Sulfuritalea sp.]|nr:hypothetical protein [Sulfuritalea sp.]